MDEAHEYFDDTVESLIVEARKYKCGLTLAHQNLAQLPPKLRAIFTGNTTIKMVGGITDNDVRNLASDMRTSPEFLMSMTKHEPESYTEFALSVRNITPQAIKVAIPFGHMESHPTLEAHHRATLLEINRQNVGYDPESEMPVESEPPSRHEEANPEERPSDERTNEPVDDANSRHTAAPGQSAAPGAPGLSLSAQRHDD